MWLEKIQESPSDSKFLAVMIVDVGTLGGSSPGQSWTCDHLPLQTENQYKYHFPLILNLQCILKLF